MNNDDNVKQKIANIIFNRTNINVDNYDDNLFSVTYGIKAEDMIYILSDLEGIFKIRVKDFLSLSSREITINKLSMGILGS